MLKSGSHLSLFIFIFCKFFIYFNQTLLNLTQNASYLMLKASFVLEISTLFAQNCWSFNRRLNTKFNVNSKFYDVTYWTRTNYNAHNIPNISQSKSSNTIDFCHIVEYNGCLKRKPGISFRLIFDITLLKMLLMLYFISRPNFMVWLSLHLEIVSNICVVIICSPFCDVVDFEIKENLGFLIKHFPTEPKIQDRKLNISGKKTTFNIN